jgi:hypothetical protein
MEIIETIQRAFAHRGLPPLVVMPEEPPSEMYDDACHFQGRTWSSLTCDELNEHQDAVFGFTPEAFCYYLPGIIAAGIRENRPHLLINASLVTMLDRSNTPNSWDDFFAMRWPSLSVQECMAVDSWLRWLAELSPPVFAAHSIDRALGTLKLLIDRGKATPIAAYRPSHV